MSEENANNTSVADAVAPAAESTPVAPANAEAPAPAAAGEVPANGTANEPPANQTDAGAGTVELNQEAFVAPEGTTLDVEALTAFLPLAAELKLDQAGAQKAVDFYASEMAKVNAKITEAIPTWVAEAINQKSAAWEAETKADSEIGGANLEISLSHVGKALEVFGGDAKDSILQAMNETGLGNNKDFIKMFAAIGKHCGEASQFVSGSGVATKGDFYSRHNSNKP